MYGANAALSAAVAGPAGAVAGYALGLLETFWLDTLLKGKNPSMFIDDIKKKLIPTSNDTTFYRQKGSS